MTIVMTTSDWINLAVAIGTISLAAFAFIAIWQTRGVQRRAHQLRVLDEIINWALDVAECSSLVSRSTNFLFRYDNVLTKIEYMLYSSRVFEESLSFAVHDVATNLVKYEEVIAKHRGSDKELEKKLQKCDMSIDRSVFELIKEATKARATLIG